MKEKIIEEIKRIKRNPLPKRTEEEIEVLVQNLLNKMTIDEKIGQMVQSGHASAAVSGPEFDSSNTVLLIKEGKIGSMLGLSDNVIMYQLQKTAIEESRLGIPLLFCNDIIHGCRTAFPINLAMSCSFNPILLEKCMEVVAYESSHSGVNLTYSPMVDLVRDPRWGRVMESSGEDTYLNSIFAKAYVKGYQGDLLSYDSIASCVKHYLGYGACEGGREYNTVDFSERVMRQYYLPPFASAIEAKAQMVMTSFNTFNDVPMTANEYMLKKVLRKDLDFKGVVISDYTSTNEIMCHKIATNEKEVAKKCSIAGLEIEMISESYQRYLKELVQEKEVPLSVIDEACKHILKLKYRLGLFDNPFKNIYDNPQEYWGTKKALQLAYEMALESVVLLKNEGALPISKNEKIALIGPFSKTHSLVGAWGGKALNEECETLIEAFEGAKCDFVCVEGCDILSFDKTHFDEALQAAKTSEKIVLAIGEEQYMSGEGSSRAYLTLPGVQMELLKELAKLNKPIIAVIFSGRPLDLTPILPLVNSVLYAWFLGTKTGSAIQHILYGEKNPSGKLTMSFPYCTGQIPVYYNSFPTGRPKNVQNPEDRYKTRYIDIPNEALFPFGFGLSYTKFAYGPIICPEKELKMAEEITVSVEIKNTGDYAGYEVVQCYISAKNFSVARPNKELKDFEKVFLNPGEVKKVTFVIDANKLAYFNIDMKNICEVGEYDICIGSSSSQTQNIRIKVAN